MADRRAVYTAIFGGYDVLQDLPPGIEQSGADFVCFTDDATLTHPQWDVRHIAPPHAHPRMAAKHFKCLPHAVLPDHEETLWVDGRFRIEDPAFPSEALAYLDAAPLALFLHPERGCIYDEAIVSQSMPKYAGLDIDGQMATYRAEGYPTRGGLYAGGILARRDCAEMRAANGQWMAECLRWTYQDQLSLPVVLRRCGLAPVVFRQYLWATKWGSWGWHAHER